MYSGFAIPLIEIIIGRSPTLIGGKVMKKSPAYSFIKQRLETEFRVLEEKQITPWAFLIWASQEASSRCSNGDRTERYTLRPSRPLQLSAYAWVASGVQNVWFRPMHILWQYHFSNSPITSQFSQSLINAADAWTPIAKFSYMDFSPGCRKHGTP